MKDQLQDSVSRVFGTSAAFAAVKKDGSARLSVHRRSVIKSIKPRKCFIFFKH